MVCVPAGEFLIGSDADGTLRKVWLDGFYIDPYETTNEQYKAFVDATGYPPPLSATGAAVTGTWFAPETAKHPVVNVRFEDAMAYARWANKRLVTEEEWERAARGTDGRVYPWGQEFDRTKCNVAGRGTAPVGAYPQDLSPVGCYDMAANVCEWTMTWYEEPPAAPTPGVMPRSPRHRVVRGGAWDYRVASTKVHSRRWVLPDVRSEYLGFRCALDD